MKAINLRVREETLEQAQALIEQRGLERAELLREALDVGILEIESVDGFLGRPSPSQTPPFSYLCSALYMDDCPFFGDSSYVEERRTELHDQRIEMLLALGAVYERLSQTGEAATCYRRALSAADGDCPRAEDGLARLQVGTV
jgi:hypothetical protein